MYQPKCLSVYLWSPSTYFQKALQYNPLDIWSLQYGFFVSCNFHRAFIHAGQLSPYHIIVYSLIIPHMKIGSTKSSHAIYVKTRNLLLKYCFAERPNWWDFTDLTFLTWEDTRQRLDIAECTTNLCSLLSNLCCVCLNDICLECSNKAFIKQVGLLWNTTRKDSEWPQSLL